MGRDKMVGDEQVKAFHQEMKAAKANYQFVAYQGAMHGFTNPVATKTGKRLSIPLAYDAKADRQSWKKMIEFFSEAFSRKSSKASHEKR